MNKKVLKVMIVLVVIFLLALYVLKIFFPQEFVMVVENDKLVSIGYYVDNHLWLHIILGIITSFITYIIAQNRPTTATVDMPVAISINGNTTTVYPLVCNRTCLQATACQISGRTRIKAIVQTNTTGGVFRACSGLGSCCYQRLTSLPVTTTTPATTAETTNAVQLSAEVENSTAPKTTRVVTNTTKEVISHE